MKPIANTGVTCREAVERTWPSESRATALKVLSYESGGNSNAHNFSHVTKDDSWGCYQINRYGVLASRPGPEWLKVAQNNVNYAIGMYKSQGWQPWANTIKRLKADGQL